MYTWVIYDIRKNKVRLKVAQKCKQLGLRRVQKSVFLGRTRKSLITRFRKEARQILNLRTDILFIVPMTREEYNRLIQIGTGFDGKKIEGKSQIIII